MKTLIATHGRMASGVKNTLSLFMDVSEICTIDAYLGGESDSGYLEDVRNFMDSVREDEFGIIFTDIKGGSVNQQILRCLKKKNIHLISGFNVGLVLEILLSETHDEEELERVIAEARMEMQLIKMPEFREEDEDSFLD